MRCFYCDRPIARSGFGRGVRKATIDHVVPRCRGGRNNRENLVGSCELCNRDKSSLTTEQFLNPKPRPLQAKMFEAARITTKFPPILNQEKTTIPPPVIYSSGMPWRNFTMPLAGLITTILVIAFGIFDLVMVLFTGDGSSVSNFLVNVGFKDPVVVFAFGFVAGHLFGYMTPIKKGISDLKAILSKNPARLN